VAQLAAWPGWLIFGYGYWRRNIRNGCWPIGVAHSIIRRKLPAVMAESAIFVVTLFGSMPAKLTGMYESLA